MAESLHYLLMADHFLFQKSLLSSVKDTGLTLGQPKILDYLSTHNGSAQKDIASGCHIEPASLTVILNGMENKGYIERRTLNGNRRSLHVFLTPKGEEYVQRIDREFVSIEARALEGFDDCEKEQLAQLLQRVYENMKKKGGSVE